MTVIVLGSGMSGLTAAGELTRLGHEVVVLDKGRSPGGRMATRAVGDRRFDHGAQHFSVRSEAFRDRVATWADEGWVSVWYQGQSVTQPDRGVEPRYVAPTGMSSLMAHLADGLDVRQSTTVRAVTTEAGGVTVDIGDATLTADAVIVTAPIPQSIALLSRSGVAMSDDDRATLGQIRYEPSLTVMATLDGPAGLADGHRALGGPVAWIADNRHKGVSTESTVTIQSSADYATRHFDSPPDAWSPELIETAQRHLASPIIDTIPHRWRYAQPAQVLDIGAVQIDADAPIVLAGEAFAGAKVEGAFLSGLAAAEIVASGT
ncbi:MAG: FAD-dependent oxidoreductase [Acidimicrobiia bacterium]|nr:FAD-dependent oxidoreductase [Acidimicrobiia bacterium]